MAAWGRSGTRVAPMAVWSQRSIGGQIASLTRLPKLLRGVRRAAELPTVCSQSQRLWLRTSARCWALLRSLPTITRLRPLARTAGVEYSGCGTLLQFDGLDHRPRCHRRRPPLDRLYSRRGRPFQRRRSFPAAEGTGTSSTRSTRDELSPRGEQRRPGRQLQPPVHSRYVTYGRRRRAPPHRRQRACVWRLCESACTAGGRLPAVQQQQLWRRTKISRKNTRNMGGSR